MRWCISEAKCKTCKGNIRPLIGKISSNFHDMGGCLVVSIQPDKKYVSGGYCEKCKQTYHHSIFTQKEKDQILKIPVAGEPNPDYVGID